MQLGFLVALATLALSCGRPSALARVTPPESDRFMDCLSYMLDTVCTRRESDVVADGVGTRMCIDRYAQRYAGEPDECARRAWLAQHGCPRDIAGVAACGVPGTPVARGRPGGVALEWDPVAFAEGQGVPREGKVELSRDEFRDERTAVARLPSGEFFITLRAIRGAGSLSPVFLSLITSNPSAQYAQCHAIDLRIDSQPVSVPGSEQTQMRREDGGAVETIAALLPPEVTAALASATSLRGRVCRSEFQLTPAQLRTLADFARRYNEWDAEVHPRARPAWYTASPDAGH
jgi:hypothetical protein